MIAIVAGVATVAAAGYGIYSDYKAGKAAEDANNRAQAGNDRYNAYLMDVGYAEADRADFSWNIYTGQTAYVPQKDGLGNLMYDKAGNLMYDAYKYPGMHSGMAYDAKIIDANFDLINPTKNLQLDQIRAARALLPAQTHLAAMEMGAQEKLITPTTELSLAGIEAAKQLLPLQTKAAKSTLNKQVAQDEAALEILPEQVKAAKATLGTVMDLQAAAKNTPTEAELKGRATANVMQAQSQEETALRQKLGAAGVKATSGRYTGALADVASAGLKSLALQRTNAGVQAREEKLNALKTAASLGSVGLNTGTA